MQRRAPFLTDAARAGTADSCHRVPAVVHIMECDHFSCDELSSTSSEDGAPHPAAAAGGVAEEGGRGDKLPAHAVSSASVAGDAVAAPAADAAGSADDEVDDLYADIDAGPQLPSDLTLRRMLASSTSEREALEAEVARLSGEIGEAKAQLQQSLRNACTILCTARLEIQRKRARLAAARAQAAASHRHGGGHGKGSARGVVPAPHGPAGGGHFGGGGCGGSGPVVDGVGRRKRGPFAEDV